MVSLQAAAPVPYFGNSKPSPVQRYPNAYPIPGGSARPRLVRGEANGSRCMEYQKKMPTKIGHFEILSELAKSPTGAVYKANDPESGQTVALKAIQLVPSAKARWGWNRRCWPRRRRPRF